MAGVISTGNHPKALWPGIHDWWGRNYSEHPMECTDLFDVMSSNMAYEEEVEATGFGLAPVKPQGSSTSYDSETQGTVTRYTHVAYSLGYIVTREELADNLYEKVSKRRAQALAFSMRQTKENVCANVYNTGFTTFTGGDGVAMLSASHPCLNGNQSNILGVAADLSEASIEDLCVQIANAKNSRGLAISLMPQTLHIAPANMFEATRILKSQLQSNSANNDINALNSMNVLPGGVKVNHYFTDTDAWFIRTNSPNGMTLFQREAAEFTQDNDFDTDNAKAKGYERYSPGFSDFRGVYGSAGA
jgi:hypothetical protein